MTKDELLLLMTLVDNPEHAQDLWGRIVEFFAEWLEVEARCHFGSLDSEILLMAAALLRKEMGDAGS